MRPLIDLHLHLDGSISIKSARELAMISNIDISGLSDEDLKNKMIAPSGASLTEYLTKFEFPLSLLRTYEALKRAVINLLTELYDDGVIYAEVRFAPALHQPLTKKEAVEAVIAGINESPIKSFPILCMMRGMSFDDNREVLELAKEYGCAIDLAGDESRFKTRDYKELYDLANKYGIPTTIHAGEADGASSILDAISFNVKRIGHGVRSYNDANILKLIKDKDITLELCPKSNIDTGVFKEISKYPLKCFIENGVKFTLNTDDMSVSDITLNKQLDLINKEFMLSDEELKMILLNSVSSAFTSDDIKKNLIEKINDSFAK